MAAYFLYILQQAWEVELYFGIPFMLLFHAGFLYTGLMSSLQPWLLRLRLQRAQQTATAKPA